MRSSGRSRAPPAGAGRRGPKPRDRPRSRNARCHRRSAAAGRALPQLRVPAGRIRPARRFAKGASRGDSLARSAAGRAPMAAARARQSPATGHGRAAAAGAAVGPIAMVGVGATAIGGDSAGGPQPSRVAAQVPPTSSRTLGLIANLVHQPTIDELSMSIRANGSRTVGVRALVVGFDLPAWRHGAVTAMAWEYRAGARIVPNRHRFRQTALSAARLGPLAPRGGRWRARPSPPASAPATAPAPAHRRWWGRCAG